jgi:putative tryptophan/tyrosine transport system substrate-binding protein
MQFDRLRRRDFISLLGGAAAWPLAARAQQSAMPVVGFVSSGTPESYAFLLTAFRRGLHETGYIEGQSVAIEYGWTRGRYDLMPNLVADLLRRQVAVIAITGSAVAALAAKAATATVPIVFAVSDDPVKLGLVASLARPGGNLTGVNFVNTELAAKRLALLRDLVPGTSRVAVLVNPTNVINAESTLRDVEAAARAMGMHIQLINASTSSEINAAFASLGRDRPDALFVGGDTLFNARRIQLVNLASRHAIPATYADRVLPEVGGLMSYGTNLADTYRQLGIYVGRILKGARPADLPVVQASKFELVINAETARMLDLTVPPSLLAIADEVIE